MSISWHKVMDGQQGQTANGHDAQRVQTFAVDSYKPSANEANIILSPGTSIHDREEKHLEKHLNFHVYMSTKIRS